MAVEENPDATADSESEPESWHRSQGDVDEMRRREARYEEIASHEDYHRRLSRVAKNYVDGPHEYKPLTLLQWKPSMRNALFPHYGRPMVVIGPADPDMFPKSAIIPVQPDDLLASLLVAYLDFDNDLVISRVDPRRVMPWVTPDAVIES